MLRNLVLIFSCLLAFVPHVVLNAQNYQSDELDEITDRIDATLNEVNQTELQTIERIVRSFYKAFPDDRKFINCLNSLDPQIEYNGIRNFVNLEANAGLQVEHLVTITTRLLFQLRDNALFCTKNLASYYVNVPPNEINDLAVSSYRIDTYGTILAWVIAHEMAHDYLDHDDPDNNCYRPSNLTISRECELDADSVSFKILNGAGYSLIELLSYFDMNDKYEYIQIEMGQEQNETNSSHPNFNTRKANLLNYILESNTYGSPYYVFSTYMQGTTQNMPWKMSLILPNQTYCHSGIMVIDNQIIQMAFEFMSDSSARMYYKKNADNVSYRISNIYAHECDVQVSGNSSYGNMDGDIKLYRDSFQGVMAQDESNVINEMLSINKEDFYRELLLDYITNDESINNVIGLLINMYAISQDLFLQNQKGEISMTIYTNRYDQSKNSLIEDLKRFLTDDQINRLLPTIGIF